MHPWTLTAGKIQQAWSELSLSQRPPKIVVDLVCTNKQAYMEWCIVVIHMHLAQNCCSSGTVVFTVSRTYDHCVGFITCINQHLWSQHASTSRYSNSCTMHRLPRSTVYLICGSPYTTTIMLDGLYKDNFMMLFPALKAGTHLFLRRVATRSAHIKWFGCALQCKNRKVPFQHRVHVSKSFRIHFWLQCDATKKDVNQPFKLCWVGVLNSDSI